MTFDWDEEKNRTNILKHGISFEEAKTVFYDNDAILFDDPDHSYGEERFLILGVSLSDKIRMEDRTGYGIWKDNQWIPNEQNGYSLP